MALSEIEYAILRIGMIQCGLEYREIEGSISFCITKGIATASWKVDERAVFSTRGEDPIETADALFDLIYTLFYEFYEAGL